MKAMMGGAKLVEKPEKKILNPQEKLAAITRVKEGGETKASVARDLGIPESTLRGWCKNSLRINYQSNRSSPDTDDALKLSPSGKRRSASSSSGSKKRSRRPSTISPTSTLTSSSTLAELNRLKAEYGLNRVNDYLTQPGIGSSPGLDAAMQGWALQMQMLLQASVAASTQDTAPSSINSTQPSATTITQPTTTSTNTVDTSILTGLRSSLTDTTTSSLYLSSIAPSSLTFPPTTTSASSFNTFPSNLTNPFLMSYLANLSDTSATPTSTNGVSSTTLSTAKAPKYSLSPQYQNTPKCPWRSNSPTAYVQPFLSSGSSSASVSPRSRTSLNSQNLNEYYGTDEEGPIDMSTSNEDSSSDSLSITRTSKRQGPKDEPMDFSSNQVVGSSDEPKASSCPPQVQHRDDGGKKDVVPEKRMEVVEEGRAKEDDEGDKKDEGILFNQLTKTAEQEEDKEAVVGQQQPPPVAAAGAENQGKKLETVLASVFQVTNNNTIVSLDGEKAVSNAEAIQCGEIFLKFLETAKDPNVTASQITQVRHILGNIKSGNVPKNGEQKKPKPSRLYSPHTIFMRNSGTSFEIATALASLLIGLGYNVYIVSGYATRDVTLKILVRTESPYPEFEEKVETVVEEVVDPKYVLKPPRDLRSKFIMMMKQREIDKENEKKRQIEEEKKRELEELEKPPDDDLHGLRVHCWVLMKPGKRDVEETFFIEATTGTRHEKDSDFYCGIESIWNHENYWVNMQDCSKGIGTLDYDFTNTQNWEHLLLGEPIGWRVSRTDPDMEDDEILLQSILEEKHLDMPISWCSRIDITHDAIERRFPTSVKTTFYKRTIVDEFSPYAHDDGVIVRISRYFDLDCSPHQLYIIENRYANRHDRMWKTIDNMKSNIRQAFFLKGREDAIKKHRYNLIDNEFESARTLDYYHENRFDCLTKLELDPLFMTEHYLGREDRLYYRHVTYAKRGSPPKGWIEGPRRIVMSIVEKFERNPSKKASEDIARREFDIIAKEIRLQYQYDVGKVTATTRTFIKPPMAEMDGRLTFDPKLTSGYQAEIGAPEPRKLSLFFLLEEQIKAEKESLRQIRESEDQIAELLKMRQIERTLPTLDVSIFNMEQNITYKKGMEEREAKQKETREKEIEEDINFIGPYIVKVLKPGGVLTKIKAYEVRNECLNEFKKMMVGRAMNIQRQFEQCTSNLQDKQAWYANAMDTITLIEEENYFKEMNDARFWLHTLQIRLARLRELSCQRYQALVEYLNQHPALSIIHE